MTFEVAVYLALHPHAELTPEALADWWGVPVKTASNLLLRMAHYGTARRVEPGRYVAGAELLRTVASLAQVVPAPVVTMGREPEPMGRAA